ncbi:MAG: LamG-like jellyroll fold domain-containing protein [Candidatus Dojkabacteria bacterium]
MSKDSKRINLNSLINRLPRLTSRLRRVELFIYSTVFAFVAVAVLFTGVNYLQIFRRIIAESVCPLPAAPTVISTQVTVTPDNVDGVVNCASLDLIIGATGEVIIERNVTDNDDLAGDWGVTLLVKDLTVQSGGKINATGKGYLPGEAESPSGDGGDSAGTTGGAGGGHGGAGGEGAEDGSNPSGTPGNAYGSTEAPVTLGSAGGSGGDGGVGGTGGGALKIDSTGVVTINGEITADGETGQVGTDSSGGGGAGGSIWIEADEFAGAGLVSANGGDATSATYTGGGGGGGRLVMLCDTLNNFSGTVQVDQGIGSQNGGIGTQIGPTCRPNTPSILKQFRSNETTEIPVGDVTTQTTVVFVTDMIDPDLPDTLAMQIELQQLGTPFTGVPTHTQVVNQSNPQLCSSPTSDCGKIVVSGLTRLQDYHWQARVRDNNGGYSAWASFGGNTENDTDFRITGQPDTISLISGDSQSGTVFTNLGNPLKVKVTDSSGGAIPGYVVSWSVINGASGGTLLNGATSVTDASGIAENNYKLGRTAGSLNNRVRASGSGLNGSPVDFYSSGNPDVLSRINIDAPDVALINQNFDTVTIEVFDQYNNLKTNYTGTINFSPVDALDGVTVLGGSLTPSSVIFTGGDAGIKTISNMQYDTEDSIKVKGEDGLVSALSNAIAVVTSLGACPDADGIIDANQTWVADATNQGIFDCRGLTITITNNAILSLDSYEVGPEYGVTILMDNLDLDPGSTISGNYLGYGSESGPGRGIIGSKRGGGASHGGYGGTGNGASGVPYDDIKQPTQPGSGGGRGNGSFNQRRNGGPGGSAIHLEITGSATLDGVITTIGGNGSTNAHGANSGGGSGGAIWIDTDILTKTPGATTIIRANGGSGGGSGGAGAGGRIAIYARTTDDVTQDANTTIEAYTGGGSYGGAGTIYIEGPSQQSGSGLVRVDNVGRVGKRAGISGTNQTYTFENIHLTGEGDLELTDPGSTVNITSTAGLTGDGTSQLVTFGTVNGPSLTNITDSGVFIETGGTLIAANAVTVSNALITWRGTWSGIDDITLAADGDLTFYPTATQAVAGEFTFGDLNVGSSSVVTLLGDTTNNRGVTLSLDNFTLTSGGLVTADTRGYGSEAGPSPGIIGSKRGGGGGHGGYGATTNGAGGVPYDSITQPTQLGSGGGRGNGSFNQRRNGGTAGGAIKLDVSGTATIDGTITANGGNGSTNAHGANSGGGSGGSIWIEATNLTKTGGSTPIVRVNGGSGGGAGGGGAGGRIAIYASGTDAFTTDPNTTIQAYTGAGTYGGAGTYYYEGPSQVPGQGLVRVDNVGRNGGRAAISGLNQTYTFENIHLINYGHLELTDPGSTINLTSAAGLTGDANGTSQLVTYGTVNGPVLNAITNAGVFIETGGILITSSAVTVTNSLVTWRGTWQGIDDITLAADGDMIFYPTATQAVAGEFTFGDLSVSSTSVVTLLGDTTNNRGVGLNLDNLTIDSGGIISADGRGFGSESGPGPGAFGDREGGGGGHGGYGGQRVGAGGAPYDDIKQPTQLGSGGGRGGGLVGQKTSGATGAGAIKLIVAGTATIDGTITAIGNNGTTNAHGAQSGGGAGGSIWLETDILTTTAGTPLITVNGGNGYSDAGAGAGGRVAVYVHTTDDLNIDTSTVVEARSGNGTYGGAGTLYYEGPSQIPGQGKVIVDNKGRNGRRAAISGVAQTYDFENINLIGYGDLELTDPNSTINLNSTAGLTGDGTAQLVTYGIINGPPVNALSNAGVFIETGGTLITSPSVTVTNSEVTIKGTWQDIVDLTLAADGDLILYPTATGAVNGDFTFGDVTVSSTSTISFIGDTANNQGPGLLLDNFSLAEGGVVTADVRGYGSESGPGRGYMGDKEGGGGGYGGYGGQRIGAGGVPYGDFGQPTQLGSGGGRGKGSVNQQTAGATGGGAIKIIATDTVTIDGLITAVGGNGTTNAHGAQSGGGSGGSIWISADVLTKTGGTGPVINANGGNGYSDAGAGGGGRIALYAHTTDDFTFDSLSTVQARTGNGTYGGAGTLYYEGPSQTPGEGLVIVNNAGRNGRSAGISGIGETYNFEQIQLTEYGDLELTDPGSTVNLAGSTSLVGDGTSQLATFGTVNAPAISAITDAGVSIEPGGVLITASSTTVTNGLITIKGTWQNVNDLTLAADGDLTLYPTATMATDGHFTFGDLSVSGTSVVTMVGDTTNNRGPTLNLDNFALESGGVVTADAGGYGQLSGPGGGGQGDREGGGGGHGGYGGQRVGAAGSPYGSYLEPIQLGSGGGRGSGLVGVKAAGGTGGGAIGLHMIGTATIDGTITTNGTAGVSNAWGGQGGGGAGGSIWISADTLTKTPTSTPVIRANGGGGYSDAGGGAGGRIALEARLTDDFSGDPSTTLQAYGGSGTRGGPGTIYVAEGLEVGQQRGSLIIDNSGNAGAYGMSFDPTDYSFRDLTLGTNVRTRALADPLGLPSGINYPPLPAEHQLGAGPNAVLFLHMDELSAGTCLPSGDVCDSVNSNNGGNSGAVIVDGKYQKALDFNGVDSFVDLGNPAALQMTHNQTIEMWLYPRSFASRQNPYNKAYGGEGTITQELDGTLSYFYGTSGADTTPYQGFVSQAALTLNQWNHVAVVRDLDNMLLKWYINGVKTNEEAAIYPNAVVSGANALIGQGYTTNYNGLIDEFGIYDHVFGDTEIIARAFGLGTQEYQDYLDAYDAAYSVRVGRGVVFHLTGDFTLGAGALIDGIGRGFVPGDGPGAGRRGNTNSGGGGGGHGGTGGNGEDDGNGEGQAGDFYGSQREPLSIGSGGGASGPGTSGGKGGGAVAIRARRGNVDLFGTIDVSGTDGLTASPGGGGGAGGSVLIEGETCDISGDITAEGGDGGDEVFDGGGGGGGRVSILTTLGPCDVTGVVSVAQGASPGGQTGQVGTYPSVGTIPSTPTFRDQYKSDASTIIPVGGRTQEQEVVLKASMSDPGGTALTPIDLQAVFEVVLVNESFTGAQVHIGEIVAKDPSPDEGVLGITTGPIQSYTGGAAIIAQATIPALTPGESYKWRARVVNSTEGITSDWVEFGNNGSNAADFIVSTVDSLTIGVSSTSVNAGDPLTLTVTALDSFAVQDPTYTGTVTFASTSGTAVLPVNYIFNGGDAGQHVFTDELTFTEGGTYTVTVTDTINAALTATTPDITVTGPPPATPTPTPTDPGVTPTVPPGEDCSANPNTAYCQQGVDITDVVVNETDETTVEICWNTNIPTVGSIDYGLGSVGVYTDTTDIETTYSLSHCDTITDLEEAEGYLFRIIAESNAGRQGEHTDAFTTPGGELPTTEALECISVEEDDIAFNNQAQVIVNYSTAGIANCKLHYGHNEDDLPFSSASDPGVTNHTGIVELDNLDGTNDAIYNIVCNVLINDEPTDCEANGVIPVSAYRRYFPRRTTPEADILRQLALAAIPAALLFATTATIALDIFAYPRFVLFALGWIKDRKKYKTWGIVFDGTTREAIPFATVRLYSGGVFIKERVTDLNGKYGMPIDQGTYRLEVEHPDYGRFKKEIKITEKDSSVAEDVEMTIRGGNAKVRTDLRHRIRTTLLSFNTYLVYIGFVTAVIITVIAPVIFNFVIVGLYIVQFVVLKLIEGWNKRNWGYIYDTKSGSRVKGGFIRLFDIKESRQVDVQMSDDRGRYGFSPKPGQYHLSSDAPGFKFPSSQMKKGTLFRSPAGQVFAKVDARSGKAIDLALPLDPTGKGKSRVASPFG